MLLSLGPASARAEPPNPAAGSGAHRAADGKAELPPVEARLWLIAPSPLGEWIWRLDNEGSRPLRVPADVRLLQLEVEQRDAERPSRIKKTVCAAPPALRPGGFPEPRALLLAPGESHVESFDPRLLCFGKDAAALAGGAVVRARFGWSSPAASKKKPEPPFAAEGTDWPAVRAPARALFAPTIVLSYAAAAPPGGEVAAPVVPPCGDGAAAAGGAGGCGEGREARDAAQPKPAGEKAPSPPAAPIVDANAPKLEITAEAYSDAVAPRDASITVTVKNTGFREATAPLRARMLSFDIAGPDGREVCEQTGGGHASPRDAYRTLKPGASATFTVLLREVCDQGSMERAGLYRVTPTMHLDETGEELGLRAYVGTARAKAPALLRLQSAPVPYYTAAPSALSTASITSDTTGEPAPGNGASGEPSARRVEHVRWVPSSTHGSASSRAGAGPARAKQPSKAASGAAASKARAGKSAGKATKADKRSRPKPQRKK